MLTVGVQKAWCYSQENLPQAADVSPAGATEASRTVQRCEAWLLAAVRGISRARIPAACFGEVPAVPAAELSDPAALAQNATVSVRHPQSTDMPLSVLYVLSCFGPDCLL